MKEMLEKAKPVADFIKERDNFVVVSHYDADGLAACAIMNLTLDRLGKQYKFIPTKQLNPERMQKIIGMGKNYVFVDLGSGQIPTIEEHIKSFAICDHHATLGQTDQPHFNAHLAGLDGAAEVSGAGMTYVVAKCIDTKNQDLASRAILGAVGDMQDSREGELIGFNRKILKDAVEVGVLEYKKDIRLFGRHSRPLVQFLAFASDPVLPGLTANEAGCVQFLKSLGLPFDSGTYYVDLSEQDKKKLVSALYVHGKQNNVPEYILKALVGEVYEFTGEQDKTFVRDVKDFATLLNSCGRHEEGEIGVRVAMGDREEYYKKAIALLQKHRRLLREGIEFAKSKGVEEHAHFYVLDAGNNIQDTLVGVIAGMLYSAGVISQNKPIVGMAFDEAGKLKISTRGTPLLVRKGLHLGKALKEATEQLGGQGGGHNIAAGAQIDPEKKQEFLELFDSIIAKQLSPA